MRIYVYVHTGNLDLFLSWLHNRFLSNSCPLHNQRKRKKTK